MISVNDSRVADFTGGTSASFTPSASSLLLLLALKNSNGGNPTFAPSGGSLTWIPIVTSASTDGRTTAWYAIVGGSPSSMTTALNGSGGTGFSWAKIYEVTGYDTTTPIGSSGAADNIGTNNTTWPLITLSAAGRLVGIAMDWNETGGAAPTSTDVEIAGYTPGEAAYLSAYKIADHPAGGTDGLNFDAAGTGTARWNMVAVEIRAAVGTTISEPLISAGMRQLRVNAVYRMRPRHEAQKRAYGFATCRTIQNELGRERAQQRP